jgi:hypothetical protein
MIEVLKQMVEALEANRPINYCENGKGERFPMFENNPFRQEANEQAIQAGKKAIAELESQEPVACDRCKQLEEQAYDLLGRLQAANLSMAMLRQADQFKEKNT